MNFVHTDESRHRFVSELHMKRLVNRISCRSFNYLSFTQSSYTLSFLKRIFFRTIRLETWNVFLIILGASVTSETLLPSIRKTSPSFSPRTDKQNNINSLTLSGRVARTAYHEKPSVFPGGTPGVTRLEIRFMWKMNRQYGNFFNESKIDRTRHNIQKTGS